MTTAESEKKEEYTHGYADGLKDGYDDALGKETTELIAKANMEGFTEGCEVQWEEYALEAAAKLTPGALKVKRGLLKIVAKAQRDILTDIRDHNLDNGTCLILQPYIDKLNKVIGASQ